jgi:hypothetical protein
LCEIITWLSRPTANNIRKNKTDQTFSPGNCAKASGYATNPKPGPVKQLKKHKTKLAWIFNG